VTRLIVLAPEDALDHSGQLMGGVVHCLVQGRCLVGDRDGLAAFQSGFDHAAFVVRTVLIAVHVAQVYFHSRDVFTGPAERLLHNAADMFG